MNIYNLWNSAMLTVLGFSNLVILDMNTVDSGTTLVWSAVVVQSLHCVWLFAKPHGLQRARLPYLSPTPGAFSDSCPLRQWCHPTISSSVHPFSSCLQSFPASGSFLMSGHFASGGQSTGASVSVLPKSIQDWFPLRLTGLIFLQSKGLSRVFNTTAQKHQFFSTQSSLWSSSHICTWLLDRP